MADSFTKYSEQPLPIPIVCTLENKTLLEITLITESQFLTVPSVSKKIYLGKNSTYLEANTYFRAAKILVPPKFALKL